MTNFLDYEGLATYNEELLGRHIPVITRLSNQSYLYISKNDAALLEKNSIILIDLGYNQSTSVGSYSYLYQYDSLQSDSCGGYYPVGTSNLGTVTFGAGGMKRYGLLIRTGDTTWIMI